MLLLFLSSFLFGLANPLGAILVEDADALIFSFFFLLMLTLIQLPFVMARFDEVKKLSFKGEMDLLILSGLIGTFLYWCEFSSLQVGLPISHVTFLLLTVPAWTLLWEFLRGRGTRGDLNKWVLALIGSFFLIAPNAKGQFSFGYLLPIITSVLTACWLIYSKKAQEAGIHPVVCSFFNDFFSLIGVFCFIVVNGKAHELSLPSNAGNLFVYSAIIGVLPNVLLFYGLRNTSIVSASTIIMLEPVMSGVLAVLIHNEGLGLNFLVGALFIVISTLPSGVLFYIRRVGISYAILPFK